MTIQALDRRHFLMGSVVALVAAGPGVTLAADAFATSPFRKLSDADWKARLPGDSYEVLRHEATERPFTSPLLKEHRPGTFSCLGCGLALFNADAKYESGTGWPSFFRPIRGALATKSDRMLGYMRTEYHCARCLGHQGHVFDDGPKPTRQRYCNNGLALKFTPA